MLRRTLMLTVVAALLTGCGNRASIQGGGRTPGDILTVYTFVPATPEGADLIRGAKLALSQAGGEVGPFIVQFASAQEPSSTEGIAAAVRDVVRDTGTIAVIGDLDRRTAAVSAPLLNAVGLLHVSPVGPFTPAQPGPTRTFFPFGPTPEDQAAAIVRDARKPIAVEAESGSEPLADAIRAQAGRTVTTDRARTVVYAGTDLDTGRGVVEGILRENRRADVITTLPITRDRVRHLAPADGAPTGFATAFPGVAAGTSARAGYDAMNAVLAALRQARDPQRRSAVIRAFRAPAASRLAVS